MPFLAVMSDLSIITNNQYLNQIYLISGLNSYESFIKAFGIILIVVLGTTAYLRSLLVYNQLRFAHTVERNLSLRLFQYYLKQPYSWMFNKNTPTLSKNILLEIEVIIGKGLMPLLTLFTQSFIACFMTVILLLADPFIALSSVSAVGLVYLFILRSTKEKVLNSGVMRSISNSQKTKIIQEGLLSLKEIKANDLEDAIVSTFKKPVKIYSESQVISGTLSQVPRYVVEGIAFVAIILICLMLIGDGKDFVQAVPRLTIFAIASYRLIPAIQQIYSSLTQIRYADSAIDKLGEDLLASKSCSVTVSPIRRLFKSKHISDQEVIKFDSVTYAYEDKTKLALNNITFEVKPGETIGLIGPTGSGKTTIIDLLLGIIKPTNGQILCGSKPIETNHIWRNKIGYVPQKVFIRDETILNNISFAANLDVTDEQEVKEAAKVAHLHCFIENELPASYQTTIGGQVTNLSGGQQQRIGIARALYKKPDILILDEATNALDPQTEKIVLDNIKKFMFGKTIIIISHGATPLKFCDRVISLKDGEISLHQQKNTEI